jgi:GLPGLI family protein
MKTKLIIAASALLISTGTKAQVQSGKVIYDETIKLNVQLDGDAAQFQHMFPREQRLQHVLYFTQDAALFEPVPKEQPKEEEVVDAGNGGPRIRMQMDAPKDKIYTNIRDGKTVEQRDFMTRKFLVSGDIAKSAWKMTGNQKTVLNYPCQEAVMIRDKDTTTAWFTTAIPISAGPHGWSGLPGLILEATRNSDITITAQSVTPGPVEAGLIKEPKGGKKVTREEFRAIVDAKRKEMGDDGNGNHVIIRVRGN